MSPSQHNRPRRVPRHVLFSLLPVALLCGTAVLLFYEFPPPWPDETLFGEPPAALLRTGRLTTSSLSGVLPGADRYTYWVPPLYFVWIAAWFAAGGASLGVLRAASLPVGAVTLLLAWVLSRHVQARGAGVAWPLAATCLIAVDPLFVRASIVGRMDVLTLALMVGALVCVTGGRLTRSRIALSGGLSGLAAACHPLGLAAGVAIGLCFAAGLCRSPQGRLGTVSLFAIASLGAILPWLLYISAAPGIFAEQFWLQLHRKTGDTLATRWERFLLDNSVGGYSTALRLAGLAAGLLGLFVAGRRAPHRIAAFLMAAIYAVVAFWGNEMWYYAGLVPFAAAGWVALASSRLRLVRTAGVVLMLLMGFQAVARTAELIAARGRHDFLAWVDALDDQVIARLPAGTQLFVNSIPDPAAALIHRHPQLRWRELSPIPVGRAAYGDWLAGMDAFLLGPAAPDRGAVEWIARNRSEWPEITVEAGGLKARLIVSPDLAAARR